MKGNHKKKTVIVSGMPPFAAVPLELVNDGKIKLKLKGYYAVLHGFCGQKNPNKGSLVWAAQRKIAERIGTTQQYISKLTKQLAKTGWITIIKTNSDETDIIHLNARKNEYIDKQLKQLYREEVRKLKGIEK